MFENIYFKEPTKQQNAYAKRIFINDRNNSDGKSNFKVTLPCLYTFGIQSYLDESSKFGCNVQFPMDGCGKNTAETNAMLEYLLKFEGCVIDHMTERSANYFGTVLSRESVMQRLVPFVKFPKNKKDDTRRDYTIPPYLPCRIPCYGGEFKGFTIQDSEGREVYKTPNRQSPSSFLKQGKFVIFEIHFQNVWVAKNKQNFGVDVILTKAQVFDTQQIPDSICDEEKSEEEEEEEEEAELYCMEIEGVEYCYESKEDGKFLYIIEDDCTAGKAVGVFLNDEPYRLVQFKNQEQEKKEEEEKEQQKNQIKKLHELAEHYRKELCKAEEQTRGMEMKYRALELKYIKPQETMDKNTERMLFPWKFEEKKVTNS